MADTTEARRLARELESIFVSEDVSAVKARAIAAMLRALADEADMLRAEVAVLQLACSRWERALEHGADRIRKAESEADSLRAQVEALRADAERYRWLRLRKVVTAPHEAIARHAAERFDAAIDAARSQEAAG